MKKNLYICHTVYHVYITLLKQNDSLNTSIALVDTIQNYKELAEQLQNSGLFCNVIPIDRSYYFGGEYDQFIKNYVNNRLFYKKIANRFKWIEEYDRIYIFNDYSEVGDLLELLGKPYHLIEDGLDVFKQFNVYEDIGHGYKFKKNLYKWLKIPYSVGMNSACIDIEVNDKNNLKTSLMRPVVEVKRENLESSVPQDYLNKLYSVFGVKKVELAGKKLLLLTQVLQEILVVSNDKEQIELYRRALEKYSEDYIIYIKAHPRDKIDYSVFEKEFGAVCLKKEIPMEVYRSIPGMNFDIVITYSSTAANMKGLGSKIVRLDERLENAKE